jgi:glutamine phosphoribosylpyrophosphate amidotransferase
MLSEIHTETDPYALERLFLLIIKKVFAILLQHLRSYKTVSLRWLSIKRGVVGNGIPRVLNFVDSTDDEEGWVISSESCGFLSIGARYYREVLPGEIVELTDSGFKSIGIVARPEGRPQAFCIFEYVYFARSDSIFEGKK